MTMEQTQISLMRATPPHLPRLSESLEAPWLEFAKSHASLARQFRQCCCEPVEEHRSAAVEWIGRRIRPTPTIDRMIVTSGAMNSILLLMSSLVGAGNVLLTEELTFPQVASLAEIACIKLRRVRIDNEGMVPDDFDRQCRKHKPKAVCVNCTVHTPTAYVMPKERRSAIASIARRYGVQIIEHEAQALYLNDSPDPFATIAPELTWHVHSLSKYFGGGVRMAFVVAPSDHPLSKVLKRLRLVTSSYPAPVVASVITTWIRNGIAESLLQLARTEIRTRQAIVSEHLSDIDGFQGSYGIHFWLPSPAGVNSEQFSRAIAEAGVLVRPSKLYAGDQEPRLPGICSAVGGPLELDEVRQAAEIIRVTYYRFWFGSLP